MIIGKSIQHVCFQIKVKTIYLMTSFFIDYLKKILTSFYMMYFVFKETKWPLDFEKLLVTITMKKT